MKIFVDTNERILTYGDGDQKKMVDLYSKEAMEIISSLWIKLEWNQKYSYTFTWLGRPIIQLPEDMIRFQEVVYRIKPDLIIETGIAHGGSLVFSASLCKAIGKGRIIGIDLDIRLQNRVAIETHELYSLITMVEGNSVDPKVVKEVTEMINPGETVLIVLDSNHTKRHVLNELESYCSLVTPGSYIVATDGIMQDLYDTPHGKPEWSFDNPTVAVLEFASRHPEFEIEQPIWLFNESNLRDNITHWTGAWLRRNNLGFGP